MKVLSNIIKILKLEFSMDKKPIIIEIVCALAETGEKLMRVLLPAVIIQMVIEKNINVAGLVAILVIVCISVFGLISRILRALLTPYAFKMDNLVGAEIRRKNMRLDFEYSEEEEQLHKLNLVKSTFYRFMEVDYLIINDLFSDIITFVVMSLILVRINIFVYALVVVISIITYIIGKKSAKKIHNMEITKKELYSRKEYFRELIYDIEKAKEIKIYSADKYISDMYIENGKKLLQKDEQIERYRFKISKIKEIVSFIQTVGIYLNAIFRFAKGSLKLGSFYIYVSSGKEFVDSVVSIINTINEINEVTIYFNDFDEYMSIKENMYGNADAKYHINKIDTVEFKNVSFKYKNTQEYALKNVNCSFNKNEKIALLGENGAGKTTFIKLLLRLYDPEEGEILVNGNNIKSYYYEEYLNAFSTVFQDSKLTGYSLLENIILDRHYDGDKLNKVSEISGIKDRIDLLDNGFDSIVSKELSEEGINFSGGEEQKISIARALYKNIDTIIMDEPTSAMDVLSEKELFEKINDSCKDSIIIYITHRLSNVAFCDKILMFENGKVIGCGSHKELMIKNNDYKRMFGQQASYYV